MKTAIYSIKVSALTVAIFVTAVALAQEETIAFMRAHQFDTTHTKFNNPKLRTREITGRKDHVMINISYLHERKKPVSAAHFMYENTSLYGHVNQPLMVDCDIVKSSKVHCFFAVAGTSTMKFFIRNSNVAKEKYSDSGFMEALCRVAVADILLAPSQGLRTHPPLRLSQLAKDHSMTVVSSHYGTQMELNLGRGKTARFFVGSSKVQIGKEWVRLNSPVLFQGGQMVIAKDAFTTWLKDVQKQKS